MPSLPTLNRASLPVQLPGDHIIISPPNSNMHSKSEVLGRNSGFTARFNLLLGTLKVVTAKYLTAALRTVTPLCFDYGSSSVEIWILREILSHLRTPKIEKFATIYCRL